MIAMLFSAAVTGEGLSQEACQHTLPIFDSHQRYDLNASPLSGGFPRAQVQTWTSP